MKVLFLPDFNWDLLTLCSASLEDSLHRCDHVTLATFHCSGNRVKPTQEGKDDSVGNSLIAE